MLFNSLVNLIEFILFGHSSDFEQTPLTFVFHELLVVLGLTVLTWSSVIEYLRGFQKPLAKTEVENVKAQICSDVECLSTDNLNVLIDNEVQLDVERLEKY